MKRPGNKRTATSTTTTTTIGGSAATGDDTRNYRYQTTNKTGHDVRQFGASELLLDNNKNNLKRIIIKSTTTAARLSRPDERRHQNHVDHDHDQDDDQIDQQQVSLLDRQHEPDREDSDQRSGFSQRQQQNDNRTTFFLAANMFSSSANNNNGAAAAAASGDFSSNKKTKSKNKTTILGSSGVMLVDNDIEAANNKTLADGVGDANTAGSSSSPFPSYGKLKLITLVLMGLILLLAILLIAILSFSTILDNDDHCFNQNSPFHQANSYKLFSTKTLYTTTFNYLSKSVAPTILVAPTAASLVATNSNPTGAISNNNILNQNNNININSNINYDKSSIHVPKIFSQQDSLEKLNKRLTSEEVGCRARQLYFVGRHAARLPSEQDLKHLIRHMTAIQARIDPTSFQSASSTPPTTTSSTEGDDGVDRQQAVPNNKQQQMIATGGNKSDVVCFDPLVQFKQWVPFADPEQGNLLTETGAQETVAIAQRFKSIYPELFNLKGAQIHVGTTNELRTAQTAVNFISQLDNFKIDGCTLDRFPSENTADKLRSREIKDDQCYRRFLKTYSKDKLMFHHKCESLHRSNSTINHNMNLRDTRRTESIVNSVKAKLKLNKKDDELTSEDTRAIYDVCKYETALTGSASIWCSLFTEKNLRLYEYLADIDDFYNTAYGHPNQALSACPVTVDMLQIFNRLRKHPDTANEAHFYFTHSQVIQKILAASVDLETDPEYATETILEHLSRGEAPKNRQWQTSLLTPFSANIAFTLYECPRTMVSLSEASTTDSYGAGAASTENNLLSLNVANESTLKIVASLNEQPIMLTGCQDYICDFNYLLANARIAREKVCKLDNICKNKVVFT